MWTPHRHLMTKRSTVIFVLGITWVFIGVGVLNELNSTRIGPPHFMVPGQLRAAIWLLTGANAIRAAVTRRGKEEAIGLLIIMPMIRFFSYLWTWLMWIVPDGNIGLPDAWYFAAVHFALCVAVWAVALIPPGAREGETDE